MNMKRAEGNTFSWLGGINYTEVAASEDDFGMRF
jgi:hypothetical protein